MSASELLVLVPALLAIVLSLLVLNFGASEYPHWWQPKPSREHCWRAEGRLVPRRLVPRRRRVIKVSRCACGTHRGEPWYQDGRL